VDKSLAETYKKIAEIILSPACGFDTKIESVRKKNKDLRKKRKLLLEQAGYAENVTDPVYECENCEDSGYTGEKMCDCMKKALALESVNYSGLGRTIQTQTFGNFNLEHYGRKQALPELGNKSPYKYMKSIFDDCEKFAENFGGENFGESEEMKRNLMFAGAPGLGKTHLSSAIAGRVIQKGYDVFYDSAQSILYSFEKERFSRFGKFDPDIIERYMTCDLLIIDDLGTEYSGNMSVSSLYNLINMRLLENRSMIISTNLSANEIQTRYDARVVSRILGEFTVMSFIGKDVRLKKAGLL